MSPIKPAMIAAILSINVSSSVYAERVFPPTHLNAGASFVESEISDKGFERPWYEGENLSQVESLRAAENIEPSPYVSRYYHVLARSYANDLAAEVERLKRLNTGLVERIRGTNTPDS